MGNREAMQPRKLYRAEADTFLLVVGSNTVFVMRECRSSIGVRERGERIK